MTFFSSYVSGIISKLPMKNEKENRILSNCVDEERFTLKLDKLKEVFPLKLESTEESFNLAVDYLCPLICEINSKFNISKVENIAEEGCFSWAINLDVMTQILNLSKSNDPMDICLFFHLIFPLFERALGNLVFTLKLRKATDDLAPTENDKISDLEKITVIPSLMKDLVSVNELETLFGQDFVILLKVLFGSPLSLNLRNLIWHGFALPGDLPNTLVPVILIIFTTIHKGLEESNISIEKRRSSSIGKVIQIKSKVENLNSANISDLLSFKYDYGFLCLGQQDLLVKCDTLKSLKENHWLVIHPLLTLLESSLRKLFVVCNNCPNRLATAEHDTLYTTFNEMLSQKISESDTNSMIEALGIDMIELLYDLLILPEGPRLRDRISHGEVDFYEIEDNMMQSENYAHDLDTSDTEIVNTGDLKNCGFETAIDIVSIAINYILARTNDVINGKETNTNHFMYKSVFHPSALLQTSIKCSLSELEQFASLYFEISNLTETKENWETKICELCHECDDLVMTTWQTPQHQVDLVKQLALIVKAIRETISSAKKTCATKHCELEQKKLRSRQRQTYEKMMNVVPQLCQTVLLVLQSCLSSFKLGPTQNCDGLFSTKVLKKVLSHCENLATHAHLSKNKWDVVQIHSEALKRLL